MAAFRNVAALVFGLLLAPVPVPSLLARDTPVETLRAYVLKKQGRQAFGVYVGANKIGWVIEETKLDRYRGQEVARGFTEIFVTTTTDGEKAVLREKTTTFFSLQAEGSIVAIEEETREDGTLTQRQAVRDRDQLVITTRTKARRTERRVPLPRESLELMRKLDHWLAGNPARGATFETFSTSLDQAQVNVAEVYRFKEKKSLLWGGIATDAYLVQIRMQGASFEALLKADGSLLKGKIGGLFDIRAEKEAVAKKLTGPAVDLLEASSIRVDKHMGSARRVESLTLEVAGLDKHPLPTSHRQRLKAGPQGTFLLELDRDRPLAKAVPLTEADKKKHLEPTPSLQCEDPTLRNLARKIVGSERDPVKAAGLLENWVYRNLKKSMAANASTALDVLDNKAGDCTEHTLLFVALARAAGIPAREVGGLAYVDGPRPLFGWHAWAEIHDGKQWVTVDPTWNEVYVDATHIKFQEDSEDLAFVNVVGKLKFKVVAFQSNK